MNHCYVCPVWAESFKASTKTVMYFNFRCPVLAETKTQYLVALKGESRYIGKNECHEVKDDVK